MSDKTEKVTPEVLDEHGELIHVPTGQSRLRYIATIALVLFLLVIFVVADLFSSTLTGGGGRGGSDEVFLTWQDPVDQSPQEVTEGEFFETARFLSNMRVFGIYGPDSMIFGPEDPQRRNSDPTEEDVASFLIYEKVANDSGIAVSDAENKQLLRSRFGSTQVLNQQAQRSGMNVLEIAEGARRVQRVAKLRGLMLTTLSIPDPDAVVKTWAESRPEFKFSVISTQRADYEAQAETEVPEDEALAQWFHARPDFEQRSLYTEERVTPKVAYLSLDPSIDGAALLEAYPAPEGVDLDQQAQSYFTQFRTVRFKTPEEPEKEEGDKDGDDPAEPQEAPKPFYDFEDVEEDVRREAPLHAALGGFLTDIQDRIETGEAVDFQAEAEALGLTFVEGSAEGMTRQEITDAETWGSPGLASQLIFSAEEAFTPRVVATEDALVIARVATKFDRTEPPFEEIREDVAKMWSENRAGELAVEALDGLRAALAEKPEDVENADWKPVIDGAELVKLAGEANYEIYDRPWLERNTFPEGETFQTASQMDRYIAMNGPLYDLEEGQVAPASQSSDKLSAILVAFTGKRDKDISGLTAGTVTQLRNTKAIEKQREFGAKVFLGDGEWLSEKAAVRFPKNEKRDAEKAAAKSESPG